MVSGCFVVAVVDCVVVVAAAVEVLVDWIGAIVVEFDVSVGAIVVEFDVLVGAVVVEFDVSVVETLRMIFVTLVSIVALMVVVEIGWMVVDAVVPLVSSWLALTGDARSGSLAVGTISVVSFSDWSTTVRLAGARVVRDSCKSVSV